MKSATITSMKKWIVIVILVGGLGVLGYWRARQAGQTAPGTGRGRGGAAAVPVEVAALVRGPIRDVRAFTGTLRPRARYVVAPKVAGRLESLPLQIGDALAPGQVLATLEDAEFLQQVEQARASRNVAQATVEQQTTAYELAEREQERIAVLRERGIASEAEWDAAEASYRTAAAMQRVAQAHLQERAFALRAAEIRLSYTRIRAPEMELPDGQWVVEERYVDAGAMLSPNTPILAVVDIGRLTAVIQVIERDYAVMQPGLAAEILTDAFPDHSFAGHVLRVAPVLREATRQGRVEIDVANDPPLLRPGLFVRVRIEFGRHANALLAPRTALVSRHGESGCFQIDPETARAQWIAVTTGVHSGDWVEILEPEMEGQVVTLGHHLLADGTAVQVCEPEADVTPSDRAGRTATAGDAGERR